MPFRQITNLFKCNLDASSALSWLPVIKICSEFTKISKRCVFPNLVASYFLNQMASDMPLTHVDKTKRNLSKTLLIQLS